MIVTVVFSVFVTGTEMVTLNGSDSLASRVNLVVITESSHIFTNGSKWQGLVGLGYRSIALSSNQNCEPDTFLDSLTLSGLASKPKWVA